MLVLLRGDHELGELKLRKALGADFRMATAEEVLAAQGVEPGFVGPVPTPLPVFADSGAAPGYFVAGANKAGFHRSGVSLEQVPQATFADLRDARPGDPCPQCPGDLEGARVIEVGNIFQLGTKYSEPMGATFLDEDGKERPIVMGSYGIGLARIAAAAVEQHHDDNGICWPATIAPFDVHLVLVRASDDVQRGLADGLYASCPGGRRGPVRRPRHEPRHQVQGRRPARLPGAGRGGQARRRGLRGGQGARRRRAPRRGRRRPRRRARELLAGA